MSLLAHISSVSTTTEQRLAALHQVRPPERMALPKKLQPPLHAFIRHLLRELLAQDTLQQVGTQPMARSPDVVC